MGLAKDERGKMDRQEEYFYSKYFEFNIEEPILMEIIVDSPRHGGLVAKIYEADNAFSLKWQYGLSSQKLIEKMIEKQLSHEEFINYIECPEKMRELAGEYCEIHTYDLSWDESNLVLQMLIEGLDKVEEKPVGLDGFSFVFKIMRNGREEIYSCWCLIPRAWGKMERLVNSLFENMGVEERYKPVQLI